MKKLIALSLAAVMALSLVACGGNNETTTTQTPSTNAPSTSAPSTTAPEATTTVAPIANPESALEVLKAAWAAVPEDQKFFVGGGDYDHMADSDAGVVIDTTYMTGTLRLPEALVEQVDNAASLIHGMNLNSMTIGAYQVKDGTDLTAFANSCKEGLAGVHWMCGFPEVMMVVSVGNVVIFGYGLTDNMAMIQNNLTTLYPHAEVLVNEAVEA